MNIGDILDRKPKRKDARDRLKVVAVQNGSWVVTPADEFGPVFPITAKELVESYQVTDAQAPGELDEAALRAFDAETNRNAAQALGLAAPETAAALKAQAAYRGPHPDSPEGVFKAAAAVEDDD